MVEFKSSGTASGNPATISASDLLAASVNRSMQREHTFDLISFLLWVLSFQTSLSCLVSHSGVQKVAVWNVATMLHVYVPMRR